MIIKEYERTGIKERKGKKVSQEQILKDKIKKDAIQRTKERTAYKIEVAEKYDIGLMNFEKEYEKTLYLLESYQLAYPVSMDNNHDNIEQLVQGYSDYFLTFGEEMSALALRDFRNSIEKTIRVSRKQQIKPEMGQEREEDVQDTAILNFCIDYYDELEIYGLNLAMTGRLINFLIEKDTPIQNEKNLASAKTKVHSLISPASSK